MRSARIVPARVVVHRNPGKPLQVSQVVSGRYGNVADEADIRPAPDDGRIVGAVHGQVAVGRVVPDQDIDLLISHCPPRHRELGPTPFRGQSYPRGELRAVTEIVHPLLEPVVLNRRPVEHRVALIGVAAVSR